MSTDVKPLTLELLEQAVRGSAAAVRLRIRLQPAGGTGAKVFPPTYIGGVYATEKRLIDDKPVECVLLDSVQSQANRLEAALLQAYRDGKMKFPLIAVRFPADVPGVCDDNEVTTLDAPHRIFDAILRDSHQDGTPFRAQLKAGGRRDTTKMTPEGESIALANSRNATPLLELCPTALVFGAWDSTGAAGGLGNKFARAIVSEIVGINAVSGKRVASRIDPLGIEKGDIYESKVDGSYVVHKDEAKQEGDKAVAFNRKAKRSDDAGTPAGVNHGNIPPDIVTHETDLDPHERRVFLKGKEQVVSYAPLPIGGGVTVAYAEQITVLSLAALRRLRFPIKGMTPNPEADVAARTVLAALALAAVAHQMDPPDYFLRSNCQLVLDCDPVFELVVTSKNIQAFSLTASEADTLFAEAVAKMQTFGLPWREEKIVLTPKKALVDLVKRSRELGGEE